MVVGALGAGLAVGLVHRVAPEAAGSGIPHVKAVLYWFRSMRWQAILLVKFVGGVVGIGSGLALGREGPTVQLGSALGAAVAHGLGVAPRERQTLIAAGAGPAWRQPSTPPWPAWCLCWKSSNGILRLPSLARRLSRP